MRETTETPKPPRWRGVFGSAALGARELAWAAIAAVVIAPVTWVEERWRVARARPGQPSRP